MRQAEFWEAMDAYQKELEASRRHIGELMRGLCVRLVGVQVSRSDQRKLNDLRKFWPMPWDKPDCEAEIVRKLEALPDDERAKEANRLLEKFGWNEK